MASKDMRSSLLRFPFRPRADRPSQPPPAAAPAALDAGAAPPADDAASALPGLVPPAGGFAGPAARRAANAPFIIGVAGGGASGKAQVCQRIMETLAASGAVAGDRRRVSYIRLEDFYLPLGDDDVRRADAGEYNFDHPEALDLDLFLACLQSLSDGKPASIPRYDFQKKRRLPESVLIDPAPDVVVVSGILILYEREIRELIDLKVFVDVDSDVRLARQVIRDTEERYRMSLDQVLQRYVKFVKPSFEEFILPTKKFADVVIPRGETNTVAVELLTEHIVDILRDRGELTPDGVQGVLRSAAESGGIIAAAQTSEFAPIPQ